MFVYILVRWLLILAFPFMFHIPVSHALDTHRTISRRLNPLIFALSPMILPRTYTLYPFYIHILSITSIYIPHTWYPG